MLLINLLKAIFAIYNIAVYNLSSTPSTDLTNSTFGVPLIAPVLVVTSPLNVDVCLFTWPIQRRDLYPVTTLNTVAATLLFLEPLPVKLIPQNTCPPLLPIQRYDTKPTTTINDISAVVAAYYAALNQPPDESTTMHVPKVDIAILAPLLFVVIPVLHLISRLWFASITVLEHFVLMLHRQKEHTRLLRLEEEHSQLAGQPELVRSLQMQLDENRSRLTLSPSTTPPTPLFTYHKPTSSPSSSPFTPAINNIVTTSPSHLPTIGPETSKDSGSPCKATEKDMPTTSVFPSYCDIAPVDSIGSYQSQPPISESDGDGPWTVVQRRKKRQDRRLQ